MLTERFLRGRGRDQMTDEERDALERSVDGVRTLPARHQLVRAGERVHQSTLLVEGSMCRYMDDREGQRQLVAIHLPGDFVDLHGFPMHRLDHDIATLGPAKVATFEHRTLAALTAKYPGLTRWLWFSTLLDAAMHREWIFRLGRLGAEGRVAHLMSELNARMAMLGLSAEDRFELPIIQADIAEACGVTGVHVNRVLRSLREQDLLTVRQGEIAIADSRRLAEIGEFDPVYLYGDNGPWAMAQ